MGRKKPTIGPEGTLRGGFIQNSMDSLKVSLPRPDEMSTTVQSEMAERLDGSKKKSRRQTKLAVMGIPTTSLSEGDVRYARCVRLASAYRKVRARELQVAHGYVSAGASALLATASLALAASRFLYEKATESGPGEVANILKQASQLADSARANELAAWELCAREAVQRRKAESMNAGVPWLITQPPSKTGPGRPRKDTAIKNPLSLPSPPAIPEDGGTNGQRPTAQSNTESTDVVRQKEGVPGEGSWDGRGYRHSPQGSGEDQTV